MEKIAHNPGRRLPPDMESVNSLNNNVEDNLSLTERIEKKSAQSPRACDLDSVLSMTSEVFSLEAIPKQKIEHDMVSVLFAGKSKKGHAPSNPRKPNQDSLLMKYDQSSSSLVIACFDGHGQYGHDVSKFCKMYMESQLPVHPDFLSNLRNAILDVTLALDKCLLAAPQVDSIFSGSTMVLTVMQGTIVTVANLGDSRALLGYERELFSLPYTVEVPQSVSLSLSSSLSTTTTNPEDKGSIDPKDHESALATKENIWTNFVEGRSDNDLDRLIVKKIQAAASNNNDTRLGKIRSRQFGEPKNIQLSSDHKPDEPEERNRIIKAGGRVKKVHGTSRVYLPHDDIPGLAMSRSFGDFAAHTAGVISVPQIERYDLSALHAADAEEPPSGFSFRDSRGRATVRCVLLVATDGLYDMMSNERAVSTAFKHWGDPAGAAEEMVKEAGKQWMDCWGLADDTTVCVVNLEHGSKISHRLS